MAQAFFNIRCLFVVAFFLSGCSRESATSGERAFPVEIGEAVQEDVPITIETIGNVEANTAVDIRPQVGGVIVQAYVNEGQHVKKGEPLFQIDPRAYKAVLKEAKAALARDTALLHFAEIKLARNKELVQADYLSKLNYEQIQSDVTAAEAVVLNDKAAIARAELDVEWSTLVSPVDGVVSLYNIDPGNLVIAYASNPIVSVRQITPVNVRFTVTQGEFLKLQQAIKESTLRLHAYLPQKKDQPREGKLAFIDNRVDLNTGTIALKGELSNEDEFLWPGEFVRVRLKLGEQKNAVLVPEEAVQQGHMGPYLYVFDPSTSKVEFRSVKVGARLNNRVVIEKGVAPKEKVVLKGQINLKPKATVHVINADAL